MPYLNSPRAIEACKAKLIYYKVEEADRVAEMMVEQGVAEWAGSYPCRGVKGQRKHFHVTTKKPKEEAS